MVHKMRFVWKNNKFQNKLIKQKQIAAHKKYNFSFWHYLFCFPKISKRTELFVAGGLHLSFAFGTGMLVPDADLVAAAVEAQPTYLTAIGGGNIGDDASDDDVLHRLAVRAVHGYDLLTEESSSLVNLSFIIA